MIYLMHGMASPCKRPAAGLANRRGVGDERTMRAAQRDGQNLRCEGMDGAMAELQALIFDCDGVLAETERDGHRVAFNQVFAEEGLGVAWDVETYGELVLVAGGKERMKHYFSHNAELLKGKCVDDALIAKMHKRKTEVFMQMTAEGRMPAREGVARLIDEAHAQGVKLFVCSTSSEESVVSLIVSLFGQQRYRKFNAILAGDVVKKKKPAPDIYDLVKERYGLAAGECVVIEDSRNGLLAAKGAGMACVVTVSYYSQEEDFQEADLVVSSLGEPGGAPVRILSSAPSAAGNAPNHIALEDLRRLTR
jgi:HAD superfamily hydrolase (TIGR01509 family)